MEEFAFSQEAPKGKVGIVARGASLEALFRAAAKGVSRAMVDLQEVRPDIAKEIILSAEGIDRLLYQWLSELVYLKEVERFIFSLFEVTIERGVRYRLQGVAMGERLDPVRHRLQKDIRSVMLRPFQIEREEGLWRVTTVFDFWSAAS